MIKKMLRTTVIALGAVMLMAGPIRADELQDAFIEDLADGLEERWAMDEDEDTMSNSEFIAFREKAVDAEYSRLSKYESETFESEKFTLLAHAYIQALEMQKNALAYYTEESNLFELMWSDGFNIRAYLLPEFVDHYGLEAAEEEMQDFRATKDSLFAYTITDTAVSADSTGTPASADQEEILLFANEGITVKLTGMDEPDLFSTRFRISIENLNHHDIIVGTDDYQMVVNGTMMYSPLYAEVQSGKSANTTMEFYQEQMEEAGIDAIHDLAFKIMISDSSTYNPIYKGEEVYLTVREDGIVSTKSVYTDTDTIRKVQELLNNAGYDCGPADGVPGKNTNTQILAFERDHGLPENTDITQELLETLEAAMG